MCKYCEDCKGFRPNGYREFARNGGARIIFDPEDVGFLLQVMNGLTYGITYCPWCGRELELPDDEAEFSAEGEIKRLKGRINHTNTLVYELVDYLALLLECPNVDTRNKTLRALRNIRRRDL